MKIIQRRGLVLLEVLLSLLLFSTTAIALAKLKQQIFYLQQQSQVLAELDLLICNASSGGLSVNALVQQLAANFAGVSLAIRLEDSHQVLTLKLEHKNSTIRLQRELPKYESGF